MPHGILGEGRNEIYNRVIKATLLRGWHLKGEEIKDKRGEPQWMGYICRYWEEQMQTLRDESRSDLFKVTSEAHQDGGAWRKGEDKTINNTGEKSLGPCR